MVTPGGEVAFVERMLKESVVLRDRVGWFSSMLGKRGSLFAIVPKLQDAGIDKWGGREFVQGNKTRRWAIAWSWTDRRLPQVDATCHPCSPHS